MENFMAKKSKVFYLVFFVLAFILLISSVVYSTQYANIHVYYTLEGNDNRVAFYEDSQDEYQENQINLYDFFKNTTDKTFDKDFNKYAPTVYKFQKDLSSVNDFIVISGLICLVAVAGLFILSNHNRKVYYKSNLIGGIVLPIVVVIFNVILIVRNFILMGSLNENYELFNRVSILQTRGQLQIEAAQQVNNIQFLKDRYNCNNTTFIIFTVLFVIIILYAIFMIFYSVYRYKASTEKRNEILERAVDAND